MQGLSWRAMATATLAMKTGQKYRKLGLQESLMHVKREKSQGYGYTDSTYSMVVDCQRPLEPRHVRMAVQALQRKVPILRVRVEQHQDGDYMVASDAPVGLKSLLPGGDWLEQHMERANQERVYNDPSGPHWKFAFMQEPRNTTAPSKLPHRAVLYVTGPHLFLDGLTQGRLLGSLLDYLDQAMQQGKVEEKPAAPVHPYVEDILEDVPLSISVAWELLKAAYFMYRDRKSVFMKTYVKDYDGGPLDESQCRLAVASLPPEDLARLHSKCRQRGVTLNAAIAAAVNIAGARMIARSPEGGTSPGPYVMRSLLLVSLGRYLPPEVDISQFYGWSAGCAAMHVKVPSTSTDNFWLVAKDIRDNLQHQLNISLPVFFLRHIDRWFTKPDQWDWETQLKEGAAQKTSPVDYRINNLGNMDALFPQTTAVIPVEVHRNGRQHPALDNYFGCQSFQTVGGRLFYDLDYTAARVQPEHAKMFQTIVMEVLREVATVKF